MLRSLSIHNIAIISKLNLELFDGMTSLTGETGAGKSIIIDSLALAVGSRADQELLKQNENKAEVIAEFDISDNKNVQSWLLNHEYELDEPQCVLRRHLYRDKPSKSFINDRPVTLQSLKELGSLLVNICGQQEHLNLVNPKQRLAIIDNHAQSQAQLKKLKDIHKQHSLIESEIEDLLQTEGIEIDQYELLKFLIEELSEGNFNKQEYDALDKQQKSLAHASETITSVNTAVQILNSNDGTSVLESLDSVIRMLRSASKYDDRLNQIISSLDETNITLTDSIAELTSLSSNINLDPQELLEIESKLSNYHNMARKHRCPAVELEEKIQSLLQRRDEIENRDIKLDELNEIKLKLLADYQNLAESLTKKRLKSAQILSKSISKHLKELNLEHAICHIAVISDSLKLSNTGQDRIDFLIATNKEQKPGPIEKIASGGELSRISLAVQLEANKLIDSSVIIFDEVDAGISGETAEIVGEKLQAISNDAQVICITHLPQVASKARHQLKVKKSHTKTSNVELNYLNSDERIEELARFLSGKKITAESLANAKVMLQNSLQ